MERVGPGWPVNIAVGDRCVCRRSDKVPEVAQQLLSDQTQTYLSSLLRFWGGTLLCAGRSGDYLIRNVNATGREVWPPARAVSLAV